MNSITLGKVFVAFFRRSNSNNIAPLQSSVSTPSLILSMSHRFKVAGITTGMNATQMIDFPALRNRPYKFFVERSMDIANAPPIHEGAIASHNATFQIVAVALPLPEPTVHRTLLDESIWRDYTCVAQGNLLGPCPRRLNSCGGDLRKEVSQEDRRHWPDCEWCGRSKGRVWRVG